MPTWVIVFCCACACFVLRALWVTRRETRKARHFREWYERKAR